MNTKSHIAIAGAGLVGSLLSLYLRRRGYEVTVFERRSDPRLTSVYGGRSINLALSDRGVAAMKEVGVADLITRIAIPMHGRMIHDPAGKLTFQPYGREGQYINSVSRGELNIQLISEAEKRGVRFLFSRRVTRVNAEATELGWIHSDSANPNEAESAAFDVIIGADGAFSAIRGALQYTDRFDYSQAYIEHGYKELHIPPGIARHKKMERNALHIWPRESFMMIALPNPDDSFTCTLFLPFDGDPSFSSLRDPAAVRRFFAAVFPDAVELMPDLDAAFAQNPVSSLITVRCFPWSRNRTLLIGDAAHAIVPFYGQGMNAGFEDCRILNELLESHNDDWDVVIGSFEKLRKPDADAVSLLALDNFVEMRDHVADEAFLLRKKIEARIHEQFPERWIPLYTMVTFRPDIRYSEAYATGLRQREIMDEIMRRPGIAENWTSLDFAAIAGQLARRQPSM